MDRVALNLAVIMSGVFFQLQITELLLDELGESQFFFYGVFIITSSIISGFTTTAVSNYYSRLISEEVNKSELIINYIINLYWKFKLVLLIITVLIIITYNSLAYYVITAIFYSIVISINTTLNEYAFLQNNNKEFVVRSLIRPVIIYFSLIYIETVSVVKVPIIFGLASLIEFFIFYKYFIKLYYSYSTQRKISRDNYTMAISETTSNFVDRIIITLTGSGTEFNNYYVFNQLKTGLFTTAKPFTRGIWAGLLKHKSSKEIIKLRVFHLIILVSAFHLKSSLLPIFSTLQFDLITENISKYYELILLTYFAAFLGKDLRADLILSHRDSIIKTSNILSLCVIIFFGSYLILFKMPEHLVLLLLLKYLVQNTSIIVFSKTFNLKSFDTVEYLIFTFYAFSYFLS